MRGAISLLNIVGAGVLAGTGTGGLEGGTDCARNHGICYEAVPELPVCTAYNSLKISVLGHSDCAKSSSYTHRLDDVLCAKRES